MKLVTITITALATEDGYDYEIEPVLDEYGTSRNNPFAGYLDRKGTEKLLDAIGDKRVEIQESVVSVENDFYKQFAEMELKTTEARE